MTQTFCWLVLKVKGTPLEALRVTVCSYLDIYVKLFIGDM